MKDWKIFFQLTSSLYPFGWQFTKFIGIDLKKILLQQVKQIEEIIKSQTQIIKQIRIIKQYEMMKQVIKTQKIRDSERVVNGDDNIVQQQKQHIVNPKNISVIINCYQQKKVSLLTQEYLLADQSYYTSFSIEQQVNNKVYILYITSYRLYLMCTLDTEIVTIPYLFIRETQIFDNQIRFVLKTGVRCFLVPVESNQTMNIYANLIRGQKSKPFCLNVKFPQQETQIYDCLAQMQRMLINWKKVVAIDNKNGQVIKSYPKIIFVPARIEKQVVRQNQLSRYQQRIPALTYYSSHYGVGLWRCGHTLKQQSSKYDYAYLQSISPNLLIIELQQLQTRRQSSYSFNHFSNQIKYSIFKFQTLYNLRMSYEKVVQAYIKDDGSMLLRALNKWVEEVDVIIKCVFKIVEQIKSKRPVLVQQYDFSKIQMPAISGFPKGGVDRASEICALIQIVLDPFYRTIKGFHVLIQKEFVSFGFPFKDRCVVYTSQSSSSQTNSPTKSKENPQSSPYKESTYNKSQKQQISPTFVQFLQCVSQLINCFPNCFQYTSEYLAQIGYELYTGKYNNFLFNTLQEKQSSQEAKNTRSFYHYVGMRKSFYNLQFNPELNKRNLSELREIPSIKQYLVWKQYWDMVTKMNCAEKKGQDPGTIAQFLKMISERKRKFKKNQ